jgi:hypothetical protein
MNDLQVGYARVSTEQQDLTAQRDGLRAVGVVMTAYSKGMQVAKAKGRLRGNSRN